MSNVRVVLDNGKYFFFNGGGGCKIDLVQFLTGKRHRGGVCFVAFRSGTGYRYSYSKCNGSKDKFDRIRGLEVAIGRALKDPEGGKIPHSIVYEWVQFEDRAARYYQEVPRD